MRHSAGMQRQAGAGCLWQCIETTHLMPRCLQSHEGGIGGEPWNEAHGGYTFCGLAAAALLGQVLCFLLCLPPLGRLAGCRRWAALLPSRVVSEVCTSPAYL